MGWIHAHWNLVKVAWTGLLAFGLIVLVAERIDYFMPEIRWAFQHRTAWRIFAPLSYRRPRRPSPTRPGKYGGRHRAVAGG